MDASATIRSEEDILADLDDVNEQLETIIYDESAEPLNRMRRRLECELAASRISRRTANLNPRFASILAASPLTQGMLGSETSLERVEREENMRIKLADKFTPRYPAPNSADEIREWDHKQDAERERRSEREEVCQE
jgi:hypothetical protein